MGRIKHRTGRKSHPLRVSEHVHMARESAHTVSDKVLKLVEKVTIMRGATGRVYGPGAASTSCIGCHLREVLVCGGFAMTEAFQDTASGGLFAPLQVYRVYGSDLWF